MNNNLSEIKILISGLLQDIESLENTESLPLYKWEDIMISLDIIKHKLSTHKYEQDRLMLKDLALKLEQLGDVESNKLQSISTKEDLPNLIVEQKDIIEEDTLEEDTNAEFDIDNEEVEFDIDNVEAQEDLPAEENIKSSLFADQKTINPIVGNLFEENIEDDVEFELFDDSSDTILDAAMKTNLNWRTDYPGTEINDINEGISFNDKIVFLNELFYGDTDQYRLSISRLNELNSLEDAVEYLHMAFPDWDQNSDTVYRFYMILRRKFNG